MITFIPSGIIILDRKEVSAKGKVISVGADSMTIKRKPILAPCKKGDIVHYKKFVPMFHESSEKGMQEGLVTLFWEDITCVQWGIAPTHFSATYDNIIIKCIFSDELKGSIIIPESAQKADNPSFRGEVVVIGPDYPDKSLKNGDEIFSPLP